ncbi:hypothetical protein ACSBLW_01030 [Thioclava sp. FR2]|uniref:hypothetical protein n=1 Tax=Thioclava sp. FR2 TaxID=3445780 RepID=UPI003EB69F01
MAEGLDDPRVPFVTLDQQLQRSRRLAQYEFRSMLQELKSGFALDLEVSFGSRDAVTRPIEPISTIQSRAQPGARPLQPPLGAIVSHMTTGVDLVAGILIEETDKTQLALSLTDFLTEHNHEPFLRPIFFCKSYAPIPLLARYGFLCVPVREEDPVDVARALADRFGISQLRRLRDGRLLWQKNQP